MTDTLDIFKLIILTMCVFLIITILNN